MKCVGFENIAMIPIVCSIGGTAAGADLLNLCAKAYPIMKKQVPNLEMVLVCGPLATPDSIQTAEGLTIRGYVPCARLVKNFI